MHRDAHTPFSDPSMFGRMSSFVFPQTALSLIGAAARNATLLFRNPVGMPRQRLNFGKAFSIICRSRSRYLSERWQNAKEIKGKWRHCPGVDEFGSKCSFQKWSDLGPEEKERILIIGNFCLLSSCCGFLSLRKRPFPDKIFGERGKVVGRKCVCGRAFSPEPS